MFLPDRQNADTGGDKDEPGPKGVVFQPDHQVGDRAAFGFRAALLRQRGDALGFHLSDRRCTAGFHRHLPGRGIPGGLAFLQVGGFITAIGEESTKNIGSTARLTSRLLGEEGTTTVITYLTPDRQEQQLSLVHSNYKTPTISTSQLTAGTCGYLRIDAFTTGTASEFKTAVDNLLQQGATCLVFDLRDNAGENLNAGLVAADYCVPSGEIAKQQDKDGNVTVLRMSDENEINVPMVCLVNGATSSSAELFANALRKMGGATIVGTKTAGMGVVLSDVQSFSDGSAAYITSGLLLDNEDQSWNNEGLKPDIDATLSVDEQNSYYDYTIDTDPQISKAVNAAMSLTGQN